MPANFIPQLIQQTRTSMTHEGKTFSIADVTPDLAEKMLSHNTQNRNKSDGSIYSYLADMQKGEWRFSGDPIRFHKNGKLLDGQHRLTAISRLNAGETVRALVITGLDDEDQMIMDQGRKRTPGDQLSIKGVDHSHLVASAIKWIILYQSGVLFSDRKKQPSYHTTPTIVRWMEEHPDQVGFITSIAKDCMAAPVPPSILAAVACIAAELDGELAAEFVSAIRTGVGQDSGSPILALRNRAINSRINKRRDSDRDMFGLIAKSWNAWVTGKSITKLQLPVGGTFTERSFPEIYVGDAE